MDASKIDKYLDLLESYGIPACDFAISHRGKEVYRRMCGFADHAKTRPLTENDIFRVYSISKVTVCVCAMRLMEQGKLKLDDPVSKYLPAYADIKVKNGDGTISPAKNTMTILHLITMTGGLDYEVKKENIEKAAQKADATTVSIANAFAEAPLNFEPGTRYCYSLCHDALAAVIEVVSGMTYSEYVRKNITEPLGMVDTGFRPSPEQKKRFVEAYQHVKGLMKATPIDGEKHHKFFIPSAEYDSGGAGLFSTVNDQMKLLTTLANGGTAPNGYQLLKPESIALFGENRLPDSARPDFLSDRLFGYSYGLCGRVHIDRKLSLSRSAEGEFGWDGAAGAFALVDPKNQVAMFFGIQVLGCTISYFKVFPELRNLGYELLGIE